MVVVLVLGVLIGAAVPTFLGATRPAADRRAESILHETLLAGRALDTDRDTYVGVGPTDLARAEDSVRFVAGDADAESVRNEVSVRTGAVGGEDFLIATTRSASGRCLAVIDRSGAPTGFAEPTGAHCAAAAVSPSGPWASGW
jgi:type II secretory pathway pseudopilin PulG